MNVTIHSTPVDAAAGMVARGYDFDRILSIPTIRTHTKTDDIPSVTDDQLILYRKAALQAAEQYTGLLVSARQIVVEEVKLPQPQWSRSGVRGRPWFNHRTRYTVAENYVFYYGLRSGHFPERVAVIPNSREVRLPRVFEDFGIGCCNPCGDGGQHVRIQYYAGFQNEDDIPAAIALGALKYIAHVVENAGDNVVTRTYSGRVASSAQGANDPALASGAIEIWRAAIPDMI